MEENGRSVNTKLIIEDINQGFLLLIRFRLGATIMLVSIRFCLCLPWKLSEWKWVFLIALVPKNSFMLYKLDWTRLNKDRSTCQQGSEDIWIGCSRAVFLWFCFYPPSYQQERTLNPEQVMEPLQEPINPPNFSSEPAHVPNKDLEKHPAQDRKSWVTWKWKKPIFTKGMRI